MVIVEPASGLCPLSSVLLSTSAIKFELCLNMVDISLLVYLPPSFSAGPSIESAHQSGRMLADAIFERFDKGVKRDVGLDSTQYFQVHSHDNPPTVCLFLFFFSFL